MRPFRHINPQYCEYGSSCAPILAGNSIAAHSMRQLVALIADAHDAVVLTGQAGSGKRALARAIHALSPLAYGRFIEADAEHFSAARMADCDEGTLYLCDIANLPVHVQLDLHRWLDSPQASKIRLIAASAQQPDQTQLIRPLYDRLWRLRIPCPPLSRRREDVPVIVQRIWMADCNQAPPILDPGGWALLANHRATSNYDRLEAAAEALQTGFGGVRLTSEQLREVLLSLPSATTTTG
jgi:DNA-binding NtrC family response regulator